MSALLPDTPNRKWLVVIAAPKEWQAIAPALAQRSVTPLPPEWSLINLAARFDAVLSGVGKANAAGATARLLDPARHAGVVSLGIAGALPGADPAPGSTVIATSSVMGDEGVRAPDGLISLASLNFPPTPEGDAIAASPHLLKALAPLTAMRAPVATVSNCSGTDALARELARRTGAAAEAMEGAAVGASTRRVMGPDAPFIELRVISNTTGDRARQRWDLPRALLALADLARAL